MNAIQDAYDALRAERAALIDRLDHVGQAIDALRPLIDPLIAVPPGAQKTSSESPDRDLTGRTPGGPAQQDPPPATKSGSNGRRYTDDDKAAAVRLADEIGVIAAATRLGIARSMVFKWRKERKDAAPASAPEPKHAPVVQMPTAKANPIEKSPHAGKGAMVPSGIRTPVDEDKARRSAWGEPV